MNPSKQRKAAVRQSGGVLILALVITAAATAGFAAWTSLMAQRSHAAEQTMGGVQRRMTVQNGIQVARHYAYARAFSSQSGSVLTTTTGTDWGGLQVPAWTGDYPLLATTFPAGVNAFSPAGSTDPTSVYASTLSLTVPYQVKDYYPSQATLETGSVTVKSVIKSRSPLASGDCLVVHRPTIASPPPAIVISGNVKVLGRAVIYAPATPNTYSISAQELITPNLTPAAASIPTPRNLANGVALPPSNLPLPALSGGNVAGGLDTAGKLNVIDDQTNPGNSMRVRLQTGRWRTLDTTTTNSDRGASFNHTNGTLTMDLNNPDLPNIIADNHVQKIVLTGQNSNNAATLAESYAGVGLCYIENAATTSRRIVSIDCNGNRNSRRIVLGIKKLTVPAAGVTPTGETVTCSFPDSSTEPLWRLMLVSENTPLAFVAPAGTPGITLTGGIQTDSSITAPTAAGIFLKLAPETTARRLNRLAPRLGWVETYVDISGGNF